MMMAKYILSILRTELMIMFSWGYHSAYALKDDKGLGFYVNGYLHKGKVEVEYDEGWDLFIVRTINRDGTIKEQQEGIYADCLVATIDAMVEKCPNYKERVKKDYGISNS